MEPLTLIQTSRPQNSNSPHDLTRPGFNLTFNRITGSSCVIPQYYDTSAINKGGCTSGEAF